MGPGRCVIEAPQAKVSAECSFGPACRNVGVLTRFQHRCYFALGVVRGQHFTKALFTGALIRVAEYASDHHDRTAVRKQTPHQSSGNQSCPPLVRTDMDGAPAVCEVGRERDDQHAMGKLADGVADLGVLGTGESPTVETKDRLLHRERNARRIVRVDVPYEECILGAE